MPGYKYWPAPQCCGADATYQTAVFRDVPRGMPPRKISDKQIHHVKGEARFWHWSDQTSNLAVTPGEESARIEGI